VKNLIKEIERVQSVAEAKELLFEQIDNLSLDRAVEFAMEAHEGQFRKSGEPYIVHPILVGTLVAKVSGDETMVIAGILHDVVEDTEKTVEEIRDIFGDDVAYLVDGLTKIESIREKELISSNSSEKLSKSAFSFRKMLTASISDLRILVIKLCDRVHNLSTLDALREEKQLRIAEESLLVYAPIAHRLGISFLKSLIEDYSFKYLFKDDFNKISQYMDRSEASLKSKLFQFKEMITKELLRNDFLEKDFHITHRIKHKYSIYRKMQRKGINIDEVLDLLALRIVVNTPLDVYKVLGIIHLNFRPLAFRFKDYIASPKDNGYQTLHTTVFDKSAIFEVQIRTFAMDRTAEYGLAAHWKYKEPQDTIKTEWLNKLDNKEIEIGDYCDIVRSDLFTEEITVYSPSFESFTLPRGSVVLDFAYLIHSDLGHTAKFAYIDRTKVSLLSELKSGDVIVMVTGEDKIPRCSWIDSVKTHHAKKEMKGLCKQRKREIDLQAGFNILRTLFGGNRENIEAILKDISEESSISKLPTNESLFRKVVGEYMRKVENSSLFSLFTKKHFSLKSYRFKSLKIISNKSIAGTRFDYCCHPNMGDEILGVLQENKVYIHHKLCSQVGKRLDDNLEMVYVEWEKDQTYRYNMIVSLSNHRGALAEFLQYLAKINIDLLRISTERDSIASDYTLYFELDIETREKRIENIRKDLEYKVKIIQLSSTKDSYKR
jgi:guanosine-3',5'-bis(diphosphate) 3'-pyrophosphohydrolase